MDGRSRLRNLKGKVRLNRIEFSVLVFFFLINLRIINWFQYPNIVVGGDLRPAFILEAFLKRVAYTWNEIDFGVPSVYSPRILDPFYFFTTVFQTFGASAYLSQVITVFLMYFFSSMLMYIFVKQLTNGNTVISFVAALYLISNVYLINDREVTAIGFIDLAFMILPCVIVLTKGVEARSYKLMAASGILAVLTQTTFPNYRTIIICLIMVCLVLVFLSLGKRLRVTPEGGHVSLSVSLPYNLLKLLAVAGAVFLSVSLWVIVITISNVGTLTAAYAQIASPWFIGGLKMYDVTALIARWGFYGGGLGMPYLPYGNIYLGSPLMILSCYLPAALAFTSLFLSKERKITLYFGAVALVSLILTSGFSFADYGKILYSDLMELAFLKVFREASNWIFFVVISFAILIGCTVSALWQRLKRKSSKILVMALTILLLLLTTYPLMTGDVTRNWLNTNMKGSSLPSSYVELDEQLPSEYWSILLPERTTYVVYNFTTGNFSCGNPYPLIFSKPVVPGTGTEYIQARNLDLINELNWRILHSRYENVAPLGRASASSVERSGLTPDQAIDERYDTRWASNASFPQWFEIEWDRTQELSGLQIIFEAANATDYVVETWNGSRWIIQMVVENNTSVDVTYTFPQMIPTQKICIYFTKANPRFGLVSMWELKVYAQTESVSKLMGILGIKNLILEKKIISGHLYSVNDYRLDQYKKCTLIREWDEVALFENAYAAEKMYVADNILLFSDFSVFYELVRKAEWSILQKSVLVNSTSSDMVSASVNWTLTLPESFEWRETSPTSYEANVKSQGPFLLTLLESYDEHWKISANGDQISQRNHMNVNGFANGWLINETGDVTVKIEYETQGFLTISIVVSVVLPLIILVILSREDVRKAVYQVRCKFENRAGQP